MLCSLALHLGIVTKFTMATVSNKIWAEGRVIASGENCKLHEAIMKSHESCEKYPKATLICSQAHDVTVLVLVYHKPVNERPVVFEAFDGINALTQQVPPKTDSIYEIIKGFERVTVTEQKKYVPLYSSLRSMFGISNFTWTVTMCGQCLAYLTSKRTRPPRNFGYNK